MTTAFLSPISPAAVHSRGPLSEFVCTIVYRDGHAFNTGALIAAATSAVERTADVARDDDIQLSLFLLYSLHYGSLPRVRSDLEWESGLIAARVVLERAFEGFLRSVVTVPAPPPARRDDVAALLFEITAPTHGPSLARFVAKKATRDQLREFLVLRSVYTLREADPHSWAIPRLTGRAKAALLEIQFDEYGSGDPSRIHADIFAQTMRGAGLDDGYGAYVDHAPALTLASLNMMSMFGLNRRLRGAIVGHLAAFEMTSSLPNRSYGDGFRRLGYGDDVTWYFDEHVEADAVHEQIAGWDLAGSLAEDEPALLDDIVFGACAGLTLDAWVGDAVLGAWQNGDSALRYELPVATDAGAVRS